MALFGTDDEDAAARSELSLDAIGDLYPIYPLTKGVESWDLQRAITFARTVVDDLPELLPESVRRDHDLLDAGTALDVDPRTRHLGPGEAAPSSATGSRRRWSPSWCWLGAAGSSARSAPWPRAGGEGGLLAAFDERLPFTLTAGQREIGAQIEADLAQPHPMNRLLQGEVGSGKTLVALRAMLRVVDSGGQAALLAPTEVLAQQHHRSITAMLGDLAAGGMMGGTNVELLTGSMTKAQRTEPLSRLAIGESGIVIGTHALLEDQVQFFDLGLVVVDEQHRFGVEQRAALTDKALGSPPHVLVMTATPIPRTVAMTVFGDLEVSTLTELPAGRAAIQTTVVHLLDQPRLDRPGLGPGARGGREGPPGLRRLPAHQRRRARAVGELDRDVRRRGRRQADRPPLAAVERGRRRARHRPPGRTSGSRRCTAGCRPTRRTARCAPSRPARSTSWSRRR